MQAKLGGAGLGLIALAELDKIQPRFTPIADLRRLGRFIVFMLKSDGRLYSTFVPAAAGRQDHWQSQYYPGEAALGLLLLNVPPKKRIQDEEIRAEMVEVRQFLEGLLEKLK